MLALDLLFFAVAAPAVVFAGVSKGGFGSGASFASASVLALVIEPGQALGIMLPLLMLIDAASLRPYWRQWDISAVWILSLGAVPGVALGAALYRFAEPDMLRVLIGVISVGFVVWQITRTHGWTHQRQRELPVWAGGLAGAVAGFTSFVSHAGGPVAAVYLLSKKRSKTEYQATTVLVFWVVNIAKFIPYSFLGIFTWQTLMVDMMLAPLALLGTWIGVWAHRVVPEALFFRLTYIFLSATGIKLIWDGIT